MKIDILFSPRLLQDRDPVPTVLRTVFRWRRGAPERRNKNRETVHAATMLTAHAEDATVLSSIAASSDIVEPEGRQVEKG